MSETVGRARSGALATRTPGVVLAAVATLLLAASCGQPTAFGEANSLIVGYTDTSVWQEVQDTTYSALQPTIFTVREENRFNVQPVMLESEDFQDLRLFRQVVIFGTPDQDWVARVADEAGVDEPEAPGIIQAEDVWATGQLVTAVVLDPERPAESWREQLAGLSELLDEQYRDFARRRMFVSGRDSATADSLQRRFGFSVIVPRVYDLMIREDSIVVLRNDNPDPSDLIRSVLVSWRSDLDTLTAETAFEWRVAVDSVHYNVPQEIVQRGDPRRFNLDGRSVLETTGIWRDQGGAVPAGGPFVTRLVRCPDRVYFLDAWLYAPGTSKYQYMLQLTEILDSFTCDDSPPS